MSAPDLAAGDLELLVIVLAAGTAGIGRAALAGRCNRTLVATSTVLRRLRRRFLIEPTHPDGGQMVRWGPPGTTAAAAVARDASEALAEARRAARASAKLAAREAVRTADGWREPVRYASVWDYGMRGGAA